ncbi:DUF523 and DUF1722 domain-containing protein [Methylomonas sp. SURF-2]|uniref:DUF523 and DUF1722 domain-containing protein n=1 Tax=Methylomonas subterranea TaxID=2952225 RepID=A0ABT1TC77_9GAMM|nr:DUF523 and DUF1722 domain-containing protein [Methylomonas sp. SURF-2]MCQ8102707.1 DUF523 and DUF1722 domain-containing protein [Methylomonas sp. SURF-2]
MNVENSAADHADTIVVGISSCLLGNAVRYDGAHKYHSYIERTLGQYFQFRAFCPEVEAGLGVPRPAVQLREIGASIRVVGVKDHSLDVTEALREAAEKQSVWLDGLCGYILKKDSPSCGMARVKVYKNDIPARAGVGVFADYLQEHFPTLPVEEEGRLGDPGLRENFIQRVFVRHRWRRLCRAPLTAHGLMRFHSRHKLIAMSHEQNRARELGRLVAEARADNIEEIGQRYIAGLMACLKIVATRGNHVNVLQHIQGYLKRNIDGDDKQELVDTIESYRAGSVPLIVPLTLLRHHFRKQPDAFIDESFYMTPHPAELSLLNEI